MSRTTAVAASDRSDEAEQANQTDHQDVNAEAHLETDSGSAGHDYDRTFGDAGEGHDEGHEGHEDEESLDELKVVAMPEDQVEDLSEGYVLAATGSMSDQELLDGIRERSEAHFAELYSRYFPRIYSFVYTRLRNHAETEEVVQETFLAVFRSFERYRGQSSLLSWIYGIAKNTANNSIRRARSQTDRIDLADEEDLMPRSPLGVGTPGDQLDLHRFQDQLSHRLAALSDWQTEIFEMRHFENLSIAEISSRTQRSSDAVRSSLYRVKRIFFEAAQANGMTTAMVGEHS